MIRGAEIDLATDAGTAKSPPIYDARYHIEVTRRVAPKKAGLSKKTQERTAEVIIVIALAAVVFYAANPSWFGNFGNGSPMGTPPQVLISAGTTQNSSGNTLTKVFNITQTGILQGYYQANADQTYLAVCYGPGCGENYSAPATTLTFTGIQKSGKLDLPLNSLGQYAVFIGFVSGSSTGPFVVTWISPLEVTH